MTDPVRAVLDIQALQVDGYADRGIGRYVAAYTTALARVGRLAAAVLAPELPPPSGLPGEVIEAGLVRWDSIGECRRLLGGHERLAYHVTAPFLHSGPHDRGVLALTPHWAESAVPRVVTLYDLIPLRAPRHYLPTAEHEERYQARAAWVAESDLVLAISDHTRNEALELLGCRPDQVVTVGAGVSPYFSPHDGTDEELWQFHLGELQGRPHVLTVGGSDARKNTEQLIAAVGQLLARGWDLHLVVIGDLTPVWREQLAAAARAARMGDRLVLTGPVSDELLRACYRRASVTVMPSLAEGMGLPVLESAASGTPALTSSTTALGETAATPLAVFEPTDPASIADCIARALEDTDRRAEILQAQQRLATAATWDDVAARAAAASDGLRSTLPVARWSRRACRRRFALVGPTPPGGGGIGDYSAGVLVARPAAVAFDAVTTNPRAELPAGVGLVSASSFGTDARPASYDAVVYAIGNSAGHLPTVELALRYPGWLWLHEVRLAGLATTALETLDDVAYDSALAGLLSRAYPGRAPLGAARKVGRSNLALIAAGVGLVAPLVERCRGVLVNSTVARRLLELDLPPLAHHPPIHVLPPGCPPVRPRRPTGSHDRDPGGPLVVALGMVSMAKRPDALVDAVADAGCRLAFVGPCPPILVQFVTERARTRGIEDRVQVVGEVDGPGWQEWLDRASLAVQLRGSSSGETSAAILEALACGVPVLTNIGSAAEYPPGTVAHVPSLEGGLLGARIGALISTPGELQGLSESGQSFAAEHPFGRLAEALVSAIGAGA